VYIRCDMVVSFLGIASVFKIVFIFFLVSSWPFCLNSEEILKFDDLTEFPKPADPLFSFQGKLVQVRGFWHPLSDGQGILAPSPNLKSCCLRAPARIHQQLIVKGHFPNLSVQRAVTLEGIFKIAPQYNEEGKLIQLYILENSREVKEETSYSLLLMAVVLVALCISIFYFRNRV
jgi:hypothetical protein